MVYNGCRRVFLALQGQHYGRAFLCQQGYLIGIVPEACTRIVERVERYHIRVLLFQLFACVLQFVIRLQRKTY